MVLLQVVVDVCLTGSVETSLGHGERSFTSSQSPCAIEMSAVVSTISYKTIGWNVVKY
jgi:hypothetical protein